MRILIVDDDVERRKLATHAIRSPARIVVETDTAQAAAAIAANPPDTLVFHWPSSEGVKTLQLLCASDKPGLMYTLVVLGEEPARVVASAFAAGAHDCVRDRDFVDEVVARVDAAGRLSRWSRALIASAEKSGAPVLAATRAWHYLGRVVADELEEMLGLGIDLTEDRAAHMLPTLQGATIVMSLAAERYELRITIAADQSSRAWLGNHMLGDAGASEGMLADLVRELANVAGGAVKRAARPEQITLTTGIPQDHPLSECARDARRWSLRIGERATLWVIGELRRRANCRLPATKLREGMVVVHDVRSPAGMLLVVGGTRLTMMSAGKLAQMLGERSQIEVADAA